VRAARINLVTAQMLELPDVTLCCIDTVNHALALRALRQSSAQIQFGRTIFISDREVSAQDLEVEIVPALTSRDDYSQFVLKSLAARIDTSHVLLVQWDGYVINPAAWREEFLGCDYIGAQWYWHDDGMRVGNGGFSLRSRKLLLALQDPRIVLTEAEDQTICRAFRPLLEREHGIRFASEATADAFAFEAAYPIGKPFGFHGLFNFCRVVPPDELTELVPSFTPAIARSPQLLQLGRNCVAMSHWKPAAAIFRRILDEVPGHVDAAAGLASASANASSMSAVGRNDPCPCGSGKRFKSCHGALASDVRPNTAPEPAELQQLKQLKQAIALHQQGDSNDAEALYRSVLAIEPDNALAQHFLGVIHYQRRELAAALPLLEQSVTLSPDEPEFRNNLGLALAAADRESDAIAAYRSALDLKPDHAVAWNNLGLALQSVNDVRGAIDAFQRAVDFKPDFAHAHWNLSLALLLDGQFAQGWREYDWRLVLTELGRGRHVYPGQAWDGSVAAGKTLLLYAEQGLGDALQFARYATLLAHAGARPLIHCVDALKPLIATVPGVSKVLGSDEPLPEYDAHFPLLSLPCVFATTAETIPSVASYMTVSEPHRAAARARIDSSRAKLNVGLVWAGSREHSNDRNRSCPLAALAPLLALPGIAWFSLQQGEASKELDAYADPKPVIALPASAPLIDTAALIAEVDLVISVDTSIAHLAGALGRRCWLLLPFAPDWRWMLERDDTPWYPAMRLFRQSRLHDWSSVVARVVAELRALAP
jgi:tetratricopeptide (TPR) repeat protein